MMNGRWPAHCRPVTSEGPRSAKACQVTQAVRRVSELTGPLNGRSGEEPTGWLWPISDPLIQNPRADTARHRPPGARPRS